MGKTRAGRFALRGQRMALLHLETMTQAVDSADSVDPRALEALNRYFGYDSFRPGQPGIVSAILTGRDVLGVMPTGAGKSICYQIPAAILPGVAIVISPLISLMRDQVDALNDVGLPAAFINTTQTPDEQDLVFAQALSGQIKLLYAAPERLETERFRNFAVRVPISLVAVDEAHCVSQWGQDFRSSYLGIGEFIAGLPTRPTVAAFTATATERVRRDIVSILGLHTPSITVTGFDRPNLYFDVISMPRKGKASWVASYIASHPDESGIVYCATRKETEALAESLNSAVAELRAAGGADVSDIGTIAVAYHGGMSADAREKAQRDFVTDRVPVVVATNAFGMGIDKSNVRYVIHHNMPASIEAYYQEAGRAGRDGEPAECLLFWNDGDIGTCRFFIESESGNEEFSAEEADAVRSTHRRLLEAMCGYCLTTECLREYILHYFGEGVQVVRKDSESASGAPNCRESFPKRALAREESLERQGGAPEALTAAACSVVRQNDGTKCCSNCDGGFESVDVTELARSVIRCVHELRGRFGKGMVADVLRGAKTEKLLEFGLDKARSYGAADASKEQVKEAIELLASQGYLEITEGRFPLVGLGPRFREAGRDDFALRVKRVARKPPKSRGSAAAGVAFGPSGSEAGDGSYDVALFERLRALRKRIADAAEVPPYIVFSDAALRDMCVKLPRTPDEFLDVSGVGEKKLARYGEAFLAEIAEHLSDVGKEA